MILRFKFMIFAFALVNHKNRYFGGWNRVTWNEYNLKNTRSKAISEKNPEVSLPVEKGEGFF